MDFDKDIYIPWQTRMESGVSMHLPAPRVSSGALPYQRQMTMGFLSLKWHRLLNFMSLRPHTSFFQNLVSLSKIILRSTPLLCWFFWMPSDSGLACLTAVNPGSCWRASGPCPHLHKAKMNTQVFVYFWASFLVSPPKYSSWLLTVV